MALDEYLYGKLVSFFKKRKVASNAALPQLVNLQGIKPRLTIFARAITGKSIDIYDAEREGGYRNNNFFLPTQFTELPTQEENIQFYLFRILFLSIQKNKNLNWKDQAEHDLE
ncbi:MAG: NorD protein, partial [Bacteroidota bacterium]